MCCARILLSHRGNLRYILTLSFSARGKSPAAAGEALAGRADSVRRALQALGIPHDSLITGSRWYWWRGRVEMVVETQGVQKGADGHGIREFVTVQDTSYRATDAIEVHFHDLRRVGAGIDSALAHGVTDISPIRFLATDVSAAQEDALREATVRARRQATAPRSGPKARSPEPKSWFSQFPSASPCMASGS